MDSTQIEDSRRGDIARQARAFTRRLYQQSFAVSSRFILLVRLVWRADKSLTQAHGLVIIVQLRYPAVSSSAIRSCAHGSRGLVLPIHSKNTLGSVVRQPSVRVGTQRCFLVRFSTIPAPDLLQLNPNARDFRFNEVAQLDGPMAAGVVLILELWQAGEGRNRRGTVEVDPKAERRAVFIRGQESHVNLRLANLHSFPYPVTRDDGSMLTPTSAPFHNVLIHCCRSTIVSCAATPHLQFFVAHTFIKQTRTKTTQAACFLLRRRSKVRPTIRFILQPLPTYAGQCLWNRVI